MIVGYDCRIGLSDWIVGYDCRIGLSDWIVGLVFGSSKINVWKRLSVHR
jgi:uncharacterized protein with beta-barrel porin domain